MEKHIKNRISQLNTERKKRKWWHNAVTVLAVMVVFCTTYALIMNAITEEKKPICGLEEHVHTDECYESRLICGFSEESSGEESISSVESGSFPSESDETADGARESGYDETSAKATIESDLESEPDSEMNMESNATTAADSELKSIENDDAPSADTDSDSAGTENAEKSAQPAEVESHRHSEDCYEKVLICGKQEHTHDESCYPDNTSDSGDFSVNGAKIKDEYSWSGEDSMLSLKVRLHGDASLEDGAKLGTRPELDVEINESEEWLEKYDENGDVIPLLNFKIKMTADGRQIDLSECTADMELTVNRDLIYGASPMTADVESEPLDESFVLCALDDGQTELAAVNVEKSSDTALRFSTRAGDAIDAVVESNPSFTIQHYLYFEEVETVPYSSSDKDFMKNNIPFINTSSQDPYYDFSQPNNNGLVLENKKNLKTFYVPLVNKAGAGGAANDLKTKEKEQKKIFEDELTSYRLNPQISYMSRLYNDTTDYNNRYELKEIWIYRPKTGVSIPEGAAFNENNYDLEKIIKSEGETRLLSEYVRFTNNPENPYYKNMKKGADGVYNPQESSDAYPYDYTIWIQDNSVIRLVFDKTSDNITVRPANFFDYDISDGEIYDGSRNILQVDDESRLNQKNDTTWYMNISEQGINGGVNYKNSSGNKIAFGNNIGTGLQNQTWNGGGTEGNSINKGNNDKTDSGATFGLVTGLRYGSQGYPRPIWAENILAPDLFTRADSSTEAPHRHEVEDDNEISKVVGKTTYAHDTTDENGVVVEGTDTRYSLGFARDGGTYTLSYVNRKDKGTGTSTTVAENLDKFNYITPNWNNTKYVFSNNFWPLDGSPSHGTSGHDFKFGDPAKVENRKYLPDSKFNKSDFGTDHNAYFGMSFTVDFTIDPGYCGPLAYWFYGDDDMWVFIDKLDENDVDDDGSNAKLIADMGGVHTSVGEYVNLWEYVEKNPMKNADGSENTERVTYRLTILYTERGASGSTCYMRFTVPMDSKYTESPNRNEALLFEKVLLDDDGVNISDAVTGKDANGLATMRENSNNASFNFVLTLTNEDGTPYYDVYDYAIYSREQAADHNSADAIPIEKGTIGTAIPENGKYTFNLRGGEYIVISNLPDNTHYTLEEKLTEDQSYLTQYELGKHSHTDAGQEDKILTSSKYDHTAGDPIRIDGDELNYVRFTNGPVIKSEVNPGDGAGVRVGDEIIYDIEWGNDRHEVADVVITDTLDEGLDFIGAKFDSGATEDDWWIWNGTDNSYTSEKGNQIVYAPDTRTVKWTRHSQASEASGTVSLKVKVNERALEDESEEGKFGTSDPRVENKATLVLNGHSIDTNTVENPVWEPVKEELTPGQSVPVQTGDEITYTITWKNYLSYPADVVIRDPLDENVDYVFDIAENVQTDSAKAYFGPPPEKGEDPDPAKLVKEAVIKYYGRDSAEEGKKHTIYWNLGRQEPGAEGYVIFKVKVKSDAVVKGVVWNWGYVQVGNKPEIETNHIDNPIYGYRLPDTGGEGTTAYIVSGVFLTVVSIGALRRKKKARKRKYG